MAHIPCNVDLGLKVLTNEEYLRRVNSTIDIILEYFLETKGQAPPDTIIAKAIELADEFDRQLEIKRDSRQKEFLAEWQELTKRSPFKSEILQSSQDNAPSNNAP